MKDTLSFVLVFLIATTTLNHGEKIKSNEKRCVGFVVRPRSGRSSGMTGFPRIDRASGMMAFPRVGRSDPSDYDAVLDTNYEGRSHDLPSSPYGNELAKIGKVKRTGDAISNGGMWFGPRLGRLHRRTDEPQSEDQQWAAYPLREFSGILPDNFTPRLGRETDGDELQSNANAASGY